MGFAPGVFGRFGGLAALCGCHTLRICLFVGFRVQGTTTWGQQESHYRWSIPAIKDLPSANLIYVSSWDYSTAGMWSACVRSILLFPHPAWPLVDGPYVCIHLSARSVLLALA